MGTNFNYYEYVMQNKIKYDEFRELCLSEKLNSICKVKFHTED